MINNKKYLFNGPLCLVFPSEYKAAVETTILILFLYCKIIFILRLKNLYCPSTFIIIMFLLNSSWHGHILCLYRIVMSAGRWPANKYCKYNHVTSTIKVKWRLLTISPRLRIENLGESYGEPLIISLEFSTLVKNKW